MSMLSFAFVFFFVIMLLLALCLSFWAIGYNDALREMKERYQQAINNARGVPPELRGLTLLKKAEINPVQISRKQGYDEQGRKIVKKTWSIY